MRTIQQALLTLAVLVVAGSLAGRVLAHPGDDVIEQHVTVDITGDEIVVDLRILVASLETNPSFEFSNTSMPVVAADVDGTPVTPEPDPRYPEYFQYFEFPEEQHAGDTVEVHLQLQGVPNCTIPGYQGVMCAHNDAITVLTSASPGVAWYHDDLYELDPFVATMEVRAPSDRLVVTSQGGAEEVADNGDGTSSWSFRQDYETTLLGLYATTGERVTSSVGFPVNGYFSDERDRENMTTAVELASRVIPFFSTMLRPLPFDDASLVIVPGNFGFGGMGFFGMVMWSDYVVDELDYLLEQGVVHEFAHSWWGGLASAENYLYEGAMFNESFAEYTAWRGMGYLFDEEKEISGYRMNATWYMYGRPQSQDIAALDPGIQESPAYVYVLYHKMPVVLRTLEFAVGRDAFTEALSAFNRRGVGGLSIDGLLEEIEAASGVDASAEVHQWFRVSGYPRLAVEVSLEGEGAREVVLRVDTDNGFKLRLPVRFTFADGSQIEEVAEVTAGQREHRFTLPESPSLVELDPRWSAVREINPSNRGDINVDGVVDAADLIEVALRIGRNLPAERRMDGRYDPLYDVTRNHRTDDGDLRAVLDFAN